MEFVPPTEAFIQNRPVLGGNASTEIGITVRGQNHSVVSEVAGSDREKSIRDEKNIHLYLGWHAFRAQMQGNRIESIDARDTSTNTERRFAAPVFIDCTGAGSVGFLAGAEYRLGREAKTEFNESLAPEHADKLHLGNTVVFATRMADRPVSFPDVQYRLCISEIGTFGLPSGNHGTWAQAAWELVRHFVVGLGWIRTGWRSVGVALLL
ncbi:MAG: FAD-dependent oxidoreductase [Pirellulaceae bacterium]